MVCVSHSLSPFPLPSVRMVHPDVEAPRVGSEVAPALPPPECGPLEPARWEGPCLGGVLAPGSSRGGGGPGLWEEPRGSGCRGQATLRSAPRAGRTGRGADCRGSGVGSGSGVPHRDPAPSASGVKRGSKEMPTQRDSTTMSHSIAGGGIGDHSHQVRVKAYYRG